MPEFIIDVETVDKKNLIRRLDRLKTTVEVSDGGMYWADKNYSQVHIDTSWNEEELDNWLWRTKGVDYVGVCEK